MNNKNTFKDLSSIDVSEKLKKKNGLSYLPWSNAWAIIKGYDPLATYSPVKTAEGCIYHTDGKTCWVETQVTINGETQNETLAVMDNRNQSIPFDNVTSTAVGKSIKRCLVKNAALFGLGLSLWVGEELSDEVKRQRKEQQENDQKKTEELAAAIKEIASIGTDLMKIGYTREDVYAVVGKHNNGETSPGKIASLKIAAAVNQ